MEKIKAKPIEVFKNIIIAMLTLTMLILAGLYIGGSQFVSNSGAINAPDMPDGAVTAGNDAPKSSLLYKKDLLAITYAAIEFSGGGGAYGNEQAAMDLFEFAAEPLHTLLGSGAKISATDKAAFDDALSQGRYIFASLANSLPYQVLYALTGEYAAAAGSDNAINTDTLLLSFDDDGKATLYMKDGEKYYLSDAPCYINLSEAAAMASDSRLCDYEFKENAVAISSASPHTQTLTLASGIMPVANNYTDILILLGYDSDDIQPLALDINVVAPHGTVAFTDRTMLYTASKDSGLPLSNFLDSRVNTLDISFYDVLEASVSLMEKIHAVYPEMTGGALNIHLDGFYHDEDTYTVVFGLSDSSIELSGRAFPHLAKFTVSNGRFKTVEVNFIGADKSGKTASPFPSEWEYNYAAKENDITSFSLRYAVDTLPIGELDARWYYTAKEGE